MKKIVNIEKIKKDYILKRNLTFKEFKKKQIKEKKTLKDRVNKFVGKYRGKKVDPSEMVEADKKISKFFIKLSINAVSLAFTYIICKFLIFYFVDVLTSTGRTFVSGITASGREATLQELNKVLVIDLVTRGLVYLVIFKSLEIFKTIKRKIYKFASKFIDDLI